MIISEGTTFEVTQIKKKFNTEEELYNDLVENDFYGGEYKTRHTKNGYYLTAEVYEEISEN